MMQPVLIERATLTQQTFAALKQRILSGELRPGDRLNERQLAASMGVSPTPVREALNKLAGDGLVVHSARQGATVVRFGPLDIIHLYEIRCTLECLAVREAAPQMSAGGLEYLQQLMERAPTAIAAAESHQLHELNEDFHRFFRQQSGNRWLQQMLGGLNDLLILARRPLEARRSGREAWTEHSRVVDALRARNIERAEAAMAEHINRVKAELVAEARGEGQP